MSPFAPLHEVLDLPIRTDDLTISRPFDRSALPDASSDPWTLPDDLSPARMAQRIGGRFASSVTRWQQRVPNFNGGDHPLLVRDSQGRPRAYVMGMTTVDVGEGMGVIVSWKAFPGKGNAEVASAAARVLVKALLDSDCTRVFVKPTLYPQVEEDARAMGFTPFHDSNQWSVTRNEIVLDDTPSHNM